MQDKSTILVLTLVALLLIYADNAGVLKKALGIIKGPVNQYTTGASAVTATASAPPAASSGGGATISIGGVKINVPFAPPLPSVTPVNPNSGGYSTIPLPSDPGIGG